MDCAYCGNEHAPADLCRARRVNRRSFFGVFAAGLAGLALAPQALTWKDRLWDQGKWDDAQQPVLGMQSGMKMSGEVYVAYYAIRRMPDGTNQGHWIEVDEKTGYLLIPARDLVPSVRSPLGRLTSIQTRD